MDWSVASVAKTTTPPPVAGHNPRLVSAAHQFEASLMSELLKPMQEDSLFADSEESGSLTAASGSSNALTGFATEALGQSISEHGGFGIARQILSRLEAAPGAKPVFGHPAAAVPKH